MGRVEPDGATRLLIRLTSFAPNHGSRSAQKRLEYNASFCHLSTSSAPSKTLAKLYFLAPVAMQFFTLALAAFTAVSAQSSLGSSFASYTPSVVGSLSTKASIAPVSSVKVSTPSGSAAVSPKATSAAVSAKVSSAAVSSKSNSTVTSVITTTIYATRTVTISGVTTTVVVSTVTALSPTATTMIVVPGTVTVSGTVQTVTVVIPVVAGTVINTGVGSMTLAASTSAAASGVSTGLPVVSTLPAAGSDATKLMAGSVAALVAIVALIA